ncbi:KpsF/GutQ family sugar-phosphate isomerase [Sphingomonas piscis]|uniref:KpsF/GutQ family sugar-phosphate isomerase n=1 Tax=Sphingomonas piscis TaxID=2714943 RepID=A0A6G7YMX9_9SPHN|nr:KpsF/GutQ family sugar-phosphate isomerase [Sphingomonas piscis]QIK78094.1 KpsF/GutQ family sugar-phosphate isomerase [Sphingomonas piscis]
MIAQPSLRAIPSPEALLRRGVEVVTLEAEAVHKLADCLDQTFVDACDLIFSATGRVVVTGMGKSGHIGRKWAATMAATGTPAIYVHPAEAAHGDLGMLVPGDVLVVISNSGNTSELRAFLRYAASIRVKIIGVASRLDSLVMQTADVKLLLPAMREACPVNIAPTTSTTVQMALGDALAMALMEMRGFSSDRMKVLHPAGSIGLRLTPVCEMMHRRMPLVDEDAAMRDVIVTMTSRGFGIAGVVDKAGRLIGVITDGDLRRHFDELGTATAQAVMTRNPKTIMGDVPAEEALHFLNESQITCAFVLERDAPVNTDVPIGIVHVHDFLRIGLSAGK